jgi:thymidine kinase
LRIVNQKENSQNVGNDRSNSKTKVRGVSFQKSNNKYSSYIMLNYKKYNLGYFETIEEAQVYSEMSRAMFMPFSEYHQDIYPFLVEQEIPSFYFRYGTMRSGKSKFLIDTKYIYDKMKKNTIILSSSKNTRDKEGVVSSRNGKSEKSINIHETDNIIDVLSVSYDLNNINYILVDEIHMFTLEHINQLGFLVDTYKINVICYGLLIDYKGYIFDTSKKLVELCDVIQSIPYICETENCSNEAKNHLLKIDGTPVFDGDSIFIGDVVFSSLCRKCYIDIRKEGNN